MKFWTRKKKKEKDKWFLENGSKLLEKLILDCNGVSIPIRFFSSHQILKACDPKSPLDPYGRLWYEGVLEDRPYAIREYNYGRVGKQDSYNDIVLSARVSNHSGFLKLIGCCLEFQIPVVVFENPGYGFLNIRGSVGRDDAPLLPWNVRLKIAKEVAIAITYLHTAFPRIIVHKNLQATCVFIDKNWNAKLTDFSISVTLPEGKTWIQENKHRGCIPFIDPIYLTTGFLTEYVDVYSFGFFMLTLLMGKHAVLQDYSTILDHVKDLRERGEPVEFGGDTNDIRPGQMKMFLELALRCCAERNQDRPKMIMVAKELKLIERTLDCNVLETESDTDEMEKEEEPLAIESQGDELPLDLCTTSSLDSWSNRSYRGFIILGFVFCFVVVALFIGNQLHTVTNVTQMCKA